MFHNLDILAAKYAFRRFAGRPAAAFLGRPFARNAVRKLVIYYESSAISFTQVFPFLYYADVLRDRYSIEVRCYPNTKLLNGGSPRRDHADVVLLQTWFTESGDTLQRILEQVKTANPNSVVAFVDSFAHSDIRLMRYLEQDIDFYLKKSLFRDREAFFRPFRGDTSLTEFYGDLYDIAADPTDWQVPRNGLAKLRLSPNFFTAPRFLHAFATRQLPPWNDRPLDIQTRFGIRGLDWYQAMRQHALDQVRAISGLTLSPPDRVDYRHYMAEMRQSKICLSPHGYGELCWRDVEAVLSGSVLIKPNMDHLETLPDIYQPGVTYLPVKWDFSDLEQVVRGALADEALCRSLTENAYRTIAEYVKKARFVDDMAFLFEPAG